ncbi:MAG: ABC transporter substrate-binding protein [Pseudomonadota bacterium]
MRRKLLVSLFVAVLFVVCLGVVAQAGETTGVTDKEILIGSLGPMTGPASNLGPMVDLAAKLAIKQANDAGGVHGRTIKYIMGDTVCGSSQGLAVVKKMISSDGVFAFHGLVCSHVGMAIRPTLIKEEVPIIITIAQGPKIVTPISKYIYRTIPPTNITGALMGKFMKVYFKDKTFTKVAIIHTQEEYGESGKEGLVDQLKKYGVEPLAIEKHKIGDTDYSAQLLKIKGLNPEVLFIQSYVKDMAIILKQAHELGLDCIMIGYMGADFSIIPALAGKEALNKFYGPTTLLDAIRGPKIKSFIDMYEAAYPEYMKNPNNPASGDVGSYVTMNVLIEALKRAGKDLTRSKYIAARESIDNYVTPWLPPISFSPTKHEGIIEETFLRYVDGKAEAIDLKVQMD